MHAFLMLSRYLAPEYFMHGIVDEKTDVFAFGVLLLEIVTGRRPVDTSKQSLLVWVSDLTTSANLIFKYEELLLLTEQNVD